MAREDKSKTLDIPGTKEDKLKALSAAIAKIEKDYGKGSVMKIGRAHV